MTCPTCNTELVPGQQLCHGCGANVAHLTAAPGSLPPPPTQGPPPAPTPAFTIVEQTTPPAAPPWQQPPPQPFPPGAPTGDFPQPQYQAPTAPYQQQPPYQQQYQQTTYQPVTPVGFAGGAPPPVSVGGGRAAVLAVLAILAGAITIIGSFLPMLTVNTDAPLDPSAVGDFKLNDLAVGGTNFQVAFIVAGLALVVGGLIARTGKRFGAGLAGGAAVTLIPFLAYAWGGVNLVSDTAESVAQDVASSGGGGTFIEATTAIGIYVLLAATILGFVVLLMAFGQSAPDTQRPLNRGICGLGALAALAAAIGQMIPEGLATFSDNFDTDLAGSTLVYSRLGVIAAVALTGVIGFLLSNRWGVGLALGGIAMYAWQWISSITEAGDNPLPPAFFNPGGIDHKPYIVTTIGVIALLVLAALAFLAARPDPAVT